jgi:hypothetical protein
MPVLGVTGTGGAGKSSVVDELVLRLRRHSPALTLAVLCVDPTKRKTGGALLGDRLRMNAVYAPGVFLRSFAHFEPEAVMIDGFDFDGESVGEVIELRRIAKELNAEMWMTAVTHRDAKCNERGIPEPAARFEEAISVIVSLAHDGRGVRVRLLKDHDSPKVADASLMLDPTTMLLMQK